MSASTDDDAKPADPAGATATGAADAAGGTEVTAPAATTDIAVTAGASKFSAEAEAAAVVELSGEGKTVVDKNPDAQPVTEAAEDGKPNSKSDGKAAKSTDDLKSDTKSDDKPADDATLVAADTALVTPPADITPAIKSADIDPVAVAVTPANPDTQAAQPPADPKIPHAAVAGTGKVAETGKHELKSPTAASLPLKTDDDSPAKTAEAHNDPASPSVAKPAPATDGHKQQVADGLEQTDTAHRAERFDVNLAASGRHDVSAAPDAAAGKPATNLTPPIMLTAPAAHAAAANANQPSAAVANSLQTAAVPLTGLAVEIAGKAFAGKNHFEIRLDPPELGRIEVRLDVDRNGQVTSRLIVDRADTLDLLRRDAAGLERALQDAGLKTADNSLQYSLRDHSFSQNDQPTRAPDSAQLIVSDESSPIIEAMHHGYRRLAGPGGGVDIRV